MASLRFETLFSGPRQWGLGAWWYRVFYRRFGRLRWLLQFGFGGAIRYAAGEGAMKRAAARLPAFRVDNPSGLPVTLMTGRNYCHQTLFCVHSLARHLPLPPQVTIIDDGSLTPSQVVSLQSVLLGVSLITAEQSARRVETHLPRDKFPRLRHARDHMPMIRKLIDFRVGHAGWQLYLDSDMLFQARPEFLETCHRQDRACHMHDRVHGYVLSAEDIMQYTGHGIRESVNAGIVALDDAKIDWLQMEQWLSALPASAFDPQLLEQTLTAMLLEEQSADCAPAEVYYILYDSSASEPADVALLHYIFHAKFRYFSRDWRNYLRSAGTGSPAST